MSLRGGVELGRRAEAERTVLRRCANKDKGAYVNHRVEG